MNQKMRAPAGSRNVFHPFSTRSTRVHHIYGGNSRKEVLATPLELFVNSVNNVSVIYLEIISTKIARFLILCFLMNVKL